MRLSPRSLGLSLVAFAISLPALAAAQSAPSEVAPTPVVAAPAGPRLAVALTFGRVLTSATDSDVEPDRADSLALAVRFRVFGLETWIEVGKDDFQDSDRMDRHIGLSLHHRLGGDRLAPYLHGGGGLNVVAPFAGSDIRNDQIYGEVGAGLALRVTGRVDAVADFTLGKRWYQGTRGDDYYLMNATIYNPGPRDEDYRRLQFGARISF